MVHFGDGRVHFRELHLDLGRAEEGRSAFISLWADACRYAWRCVGVEIFGPSNFFAQQTVILRPSGPPWSNPASCSLHATHQKKWSPLIAKKRKVSKISQGDISACSGWNRVISILKLTPPFLLFNLRRFVAISLRIMKSLLGIEMAERRVWTTIEKLKPSDFHQRDQKQYHLLWSSADILCEYFGFPEWTDEHWSTIKEEIATSTLRTGTGLLCGLEDFELWQTILWCFLSSIKETVVVLAINLSK
jgi:hypothetical protein